MNKFTKRRVVNNKKIDLFKKESYNEIKNIRYSDSAKQYIKSKTKKYH